MIYIFNACNLSLIYNKKKLVINYLICHIFIMGLGMVKSNVFSKNLVYFLTLPLFSVLTSTAHAVVTRDNPTFWVESSEFHAVHNSRWCDGPINGYDYDPGIRGPAAQDPRFSLNVRVDIAYPRPCGDNTILTGAKAADEIIGRILRQPRPAGKLAIEFVRLGTVHPDASEWEQQTVKLFFHPQDGLRPNFAGLTEHGWATPWKSNGIAATRAWVQEFITRYKSRQAENPAIPNPTRFIFDVEVGLDFEDAPQIVLYMKHDLSNRWKNEIVPGTDKTMAQLEADYRRQPNYHPYNYEDPQDPNNNYWWNWYRDVCRKAISGAQRAAIYDLVEAAWPGVQTSNFGYYTTDGVTDPNTPPYTRRISTVHDLRDGYSNDGPTKNFETMAAPLFYSPWIIVGANEAEHLYSYESYMRHQIESIRHSNGGFPTSKIAPWIAMSRLTWPDGAIYLYNPVTDFRGTFDNFIITRNWSRTALALFRAHGIQEINLYSPGFTTPDSPTYNTLPLTDAWIDFHQIVNQVWAFDMDTASRGLNNEPINTQDLALSGMTPVTNSGNKTQVSARFLLRSTVDMPSRLRINTESSATGPARVNNVIAIQRANGTWLEISTINESTSDKRWLRSIDVPGLITDYLQADGHINIMHQHRNISGNSTINSKFELIQLIGIDGPPIASNAVSAAGASPAPKNDNNGKNPNLPANTTPTVSAFTTISK